MKIYIATSLKNVEMMKYIRDWFIDNDIFITYDWSVHGFVSDHNLLYDIAVAEKRGVKDADIVLVVFPAEKGSHTELGIALGLDKEIVILNEGEFDEFRPFYLLDNVKIFNNMALALHYILKRSDDLDEIENVRRLNYCF